MCLFWKAYLSLWIASGPVLLAGHIRLTTTREFLWYFIGRTLARQKLRILVTLSLLVRNRLISEPEPILFTVYQNVGGLSLSATQGRGRWHAAVPESWLESKPQYKHKHDHSTRKWIIKLWRKTLLVSDSVLFRQIRCKTAPNLRYSTEDAKIRRRWSSTL